MVKPITELHDKALKAQITSARLRGPTPGAEEARAMLAEIEHRMDKARLDKDRKSWRSYLTQVKEWVSQAVPQSSRGARASRRLNAERSSRQSSSESPLFSSEQPEDLNVDTDDDSNHHAVAPNFVHPLFARNNSHASVSPNFAQPLSAPNVAQAMGSPHIAQSPFAPNFAQPSSVPNLAQAMVSPHIAQSPFIPNIAQSQFVPNIAQSTSAPNIAQSQFAPNIAQSQFAPNIAQSQFAPNITQSPFAPHTAQPSVAPIGLQNSFGNYSRPGVFSSQDLSYLAEIKPFSGDAADWPFWKDLIQRQVFANIGIDDQMKVNIVSTRLPSDVRNTFITAYLPNGSLSEAWALISTQYENASDFSANVHIAIADMPQVRNDRDVENLKKIKQDITRLNGIMIQKGETYKAKADGLCFLIADKFYHTAKEKIIKMEPTLAKLAIQVAQWAKEASMLRLYAPSTSRTQSSHSQASHSGGIRRTQAGVHQIQSDSRQHTQGIENKNYRPPYCFFCPQSQDHYASDCTAVSVEDRRRIIFSRRLCFGCLRKGHSSETCRHKHKLSCNICQGDHCTGMHGLTDLLSGNGVHQIGAPPSDNIGKPRSS